MREFQFFESIIEKCDLFLFKPNTALKSKTAFVHLNCIARNSRERKLCLTVNNYLNMVIEGFVQEGLRLSNQWGYYPSGILLRQQ
jgi:hypothetical protein